ncbi:MAG TPA: hypothetical protein VIQ51_06645 [Chryseosolibacter sp.]
MKTQQTLEEKEQQLTVLLASRKVMTVCNNLVVVCLENKDVLPSRYMDLINYVELFIRKQDLKSEFNLQKES